MTEGPQRKRVPESPRLATTHPWSRLSARYFRIALGVVVLSSIAGYLLDTPIYPIAFAPFASWFFVYGWQMRRLAPAAAVTAATTEKILAGDLAGARSALDAAPQRTAYARTLIAFQRGLIAILDAEFEDALAHLTAVVDARPLPLPLSMSAEARGVVAIEARAQRALAYASLGQEARALEDALAVVTASGVGPGAFARAELARGVVLLRKGAMDDLGAFLAAYPDETNDVLSVRERALVRALRKLARSRAKSAYREPADPGAAAADPIAGWIALVAPGAAAFTTPSRSTPALAPAPPLASASEGALASLDAKRSQAATRALRSRRTKLSAIVGGTILAVAAFLVAVAYLPAGTPIPDFTVLLMLTAILPLVALQLLVWRQRALLGRVRAAQVAWMRGDGATAVTAAKKLASGRALAVAAEAEYFLAGIALSNGDFPEAAAACDRGLLRLEQHPALKLAYADLLAPGLLARHAYALAAMGREGEAVAELARADAAYPMYAFAKAARFTVHLLTAVKRGDEAGAAAIASERDLRLPIGWREETLADVVLALAGAARDEQDSLRGELERSPRLAHWVEAVLPGALARLGATPAAG